MNVYETATHLARDLRKRQTKEEKLLWHELRNRKFFGKKFFRQHPIFFDYCGRNAFFIADFSCREDRLVIEVDGKSHKYQGEYDEYRTYIVNSLGMEVVRFKNEDIEERMNQVLRELRLLIRI